jgi:alpha-methylacyl-CoA racemase
VSGPLEGLTVLDLSRLAPGPYAGMMLADLGADVIVVDGGRAGKQVADFTRGKRFIRLNVKEPAGLAALRHLATTADVVLEGFRPGVVDRLGIGYEDLRAVNPALIYCSLTGYGQDGPLARQAGHDINYLAIAGLLGAVGPVDGPPLPPLNVVADLAGGSMLAVIGILAAVVERQRSGQGQLVDVAMVDGVISMMKLWIEGWGSAVLPERGRGMTTGEAPFYRCYACADDRYVAVGAVEPQFFAALWAALEMEGAPPDHLDPAGWPELEKLLADRFGAQTRDEWITQLDGSESCVTPVLDPDEVASHPQNVARHGTWDGADVPAVPLFSRTPQRRGVLDHQDVTAAVLHDAGVPDDEIAVVLDEVARDVPPGLPWPPLREGSAPTTKETETA